MPGDKNDNPAVTEAPAKIYTREMLRALPKTTQFMAVDTSKAGDYYATYAGVDLWQLLQDAGISPEATDITVFAADGYSRNFSIKELKESYEQGKYYAKYPWIRSPLEVDYEDGEQIRGDIKFLLAYERDGYPLLEAKIVAKDGKSELEGEGPYRFISPLTSPVVPDRSQWSVDREDAPYPYNPNRRVTRNGDYCIKAVVAIRVNTETNKSFQYDWSGRAWEMVEKGELLVYGALKP